jgi:hypothetical protein
VGVIFAEIGGRKKMKVKDWVELHNALERQLNQIRESILYLRAERKLVEEEVERDERFPVQLLLNEYREKEKELEGLRGKEVYEKSNIRCAAVTCYYNNRGNCLSLHCSMNNPCNTYTTIAPVG